MSSSGAMRAFLVAALVLGAAPAWADEAQVTWDAPAGCPDEATVRAAVVTDLGRDLRDGEVTATMTVKGRGRHWKVTMTVALADGDPGVRTLTAASCAELADSAALILALTIDPFAGTRAPDAADGAGDPEDPPTIEIAEPMEAEEAVDEEEPPVVADLHRINVDTSSDEPKPPLPRVLRFRALVGTDFGSLPRPASGWGGAAEYAWGPWSIDAGVSSYAEQRAELKAMPTEGAIIGLTALDLRWCYTSGRRPWRAGGCLGGEADITRSVGFGFTTPAPHDSVGGGIQVGAVWALRVVGPIGVRADVDATVQFARTVLVDDQRQIIHDPELLVWRGFAGLEASWE
jgi:hypothetical protein